MGPMGCSETSVTTTLLGVTSHKSEDGDYNVCFHNRSYLTSLTSARQLSRDVDLRCRLSIVVMSQARIVCGMRAGDGHLSMVTRLRAWRLVNLGSIPDKDVSVLRSAETGSGTHRAFPGVKRLVHYLEMQ